MPDRPYDQDAPRRQITLAPWLLPAAATLAVCFALLAVGRLTRTDHHDTARRRSCVTSDEAAYTVFSCGGGGMPAEACIARYGDRTHLFCMTMDQTTANTLYPAGSRARFRLGDAGQIIVGIDPATTSTGTV